MTDRFVVVGDPISHSKSPALHTAAFKALELDATYETMRAVPADLALIVDRLKAGGLRGVNLTMPNKHAGVDLADQLTPEAQAARSVNTWFMAGDALVGDSTDGEGLRFAFAHSDQPDGVVLVLGAGGAARAAVKALADRPVLVSARRASAAQELVSMGAGGTVPWGAAVEDAIVVNATPLGMNGESLPEVVVDHSAGLVDMVYGGLTPAVKRAVKRGVPATDGGPMLVGQAAASFERWWGQPAPIEVMLEALTQIPE